MHEEVDEVIKLAEQDLELKAPYEDEALEAENLSQQQALDSEADLSSILSSMSEISSYLFRRSSLGF
jgi:hypothetical protein